MPAVSSPRANVAPSLDPKANRVKYYVPEIGYGRAMASGIYFIEVATPTDQSRKKVVLAK